MEVGLEPHGSRSQYCSHFIHLVFRYMEMHEKSTGYGTLPAISPAERTIIDELVADGLSIQEKFKPEPLYKRTGKGHYESTTVEDIRRAKENLNKRTK